MREIRVAVAQFEARDREKEFNLQRIHALTRQGAEQGTEVVSFHECCVSGYTYLQTLRRDELAAIAEPVPGGPSTRALEGIAKEFGTVVAAGLVEIEGNRLYNTYVVVSPGGFVAKHRKLHPFVSKHLSPGDRYRGHVCYYAFRECSSARSSRCLGRRGLTFRGRCIM